MSQYKPEGVNLVNYTARARRSDLESSHIAAEKLNKSGRLPNQQRTVLEAIATHRGLAAKQLGVKMETMLSGSYEWPRKRARELERAGLIKRLPTGIDKQMQMFITEPGKEYLKG